MAQYILKRVLIAIPVLIGISIIAFFLIRLVPGDTVTAMLGAHYSEERAETLRAAYGLDRSIIAQYGIWASHVLQGDFGYSYFTGQPVLEAILQRLPVTLQLTAMSIIIAILVGLPLGVLAALHRTSVIDYLASFTGLIGVSVPHFWMGTLMILFFSLYLGWLPSGSFVGIAESLIDNLRHLIMPAAALGIYVGAVVTRMTRSSMLEVLGQEYIKMSRAKGTPRRHLIYVHALKNALIPVITIIGIQMGYLLAGQVVMEQVFALPGVGRLAIQSIANRDYILMQGTILFIGTAFVLINLLVDILYALINPQVRY